MNIDHSFSKKPNCTMFLFAVVLFTLFNVSPIKAQSWDWFTIGKGKITATYISPQKDLWISVNNYGILRRNESGTIDSWYTKDKYTNYVSCFLGDVSGNMYFGTSGLGLFYMDNIGNIKSYTTKDGLIGDSILCLTKSPDGTILIGTTQGMSQFTGAKFINFTIKNGLTGDRVNSLRWFKDVLIICNSMGVEVADASLNILNVFKNPSGLYTNNHSPVMDTAGLIWWANSSKGLINYNFKTKTIGYLDSAKSKLQSNRVTGLAYFPAAHRFYVGTPIGLIVTNITGLFSLNQKDVYGSLPTSNITFLYQNADKIWVGSGLDYYDFGDLNAQLTRITPSTNVWTREICYRNRLVMPALWNAESGRGDTCYIAGLRPMVMQVTPMKLQSTYVKTPNYKIFGVVYDQERASNGETYALIDSGLYRYKSMGELELKLKFNMSLIPKKISADSWGNLWINYWDTNQVDRYNVITEKTVNIQSELTSLSIPGVYRLFSDSRKNLWLIDTRGWIYKYNGTTYEYIGAYSINTKPEIDIEMAGNGEIYLISNRMHEVYKWKNPNTWLRNMLPDNIQPDLLYRLSTDVNNDLWITGWDSAMKTQAGIKFNLETKEVIEMATAVDEFVPNASFDKMWAFGAYKLGITSIVKRSNAIFNDPGTNKQSFLVYPNPSNSNGIYLQLPSSANTETVTLVDALGRMISIKIQPNGYMPTQHLSSGLYYIAVASKDSNVIFQSSFVIE